MMNVCSDVAKEDIEDHVTFIDSIAWYGYLVVDVDGDISDVHLRRLEQVLMSLGVRIIEVVSTDDDTRATQIYALMPMIGKSYCSVWKSSLGKAYLPRMPQMILRNIKCVIFTYNARYTLRLVPYAEDPHIQWPVE